MATDIYKFDYESVVTKRGKEAQSPLACTCMSILKVDWTMYFGLPFSVRSITQWHYSLSFNNSSRLYKKVGGVWYITVMTEIS
jgi:hypothetical protein